MKVLGNERSGAIFSDDADYRYRLWRCWNPELPRACFVLLNPSTADEIENDPTIERQQRRVMQWSKAKGGFDSSLFPGDLWYVAPPELRRFGSIEIVNAFAYRSTDPGSLYIVDDPVGADNDTAILNATTYAHGSGGIIVCGWGSHAEFGERDFELRKFFRRHNLPVSAFKINAGGTPSHPLYLPYSMRPRAWDLDSGTLGAEVV